MNFIFHDYNATYAANGNVVSALILGEAQPHIFADSFLNAKRAVEERLDAIRQSQIEAAWSRK